MQRAINSSVCVEMTTWGTNLSSLYQQSTPKVGLLKTYLNINLKFPTTSSSTYSGKCRNASGWFSASGSLLAVRTNGTYTAGLTYWTVFPGA